MAPKCRKARRIGSQQSARSSASSSSAVLATSLLAIFGWMPFCVQRLAIDMLGEKDEDSTYLQYVSKFAQTTTTTAFSGIGAPEQAAWYLVQWMLASFSGYADLPATFEILNVMHAIEWDLHCQDELLAGKHPPQCLFSDITEFITAEVFKRLKKCCHKLTLPQLVQQMRTGQFCQLSGPECKVHKRPCRLQRGHLHIGGPPCTDWSSQWYKHLKSLGPTYIATLAWFCLRLELREECVIHENVLGFDMEILKAFLSGMYAVHTAEFCVSQLGWPIRRPRRITILLRLDTYFRVCCPWSEFVSSCFRVTGMNFKQFIVNTASLPQELAAELGWAQARKTSLFNVLDADLLQVLSEECAPWGVDPDLVLQLVLESRWTKALLPSEARRLFGYRKLNQRRGGKPSLLVCCPGQEPTLHPQMSADDAISTLISSTAMLWVDAAGRWLTPMEMLSLQGFMTRPEHCAFPGMSSNFMAHRERDRTAVIHQAGNTMHCQVMGMALLWCICAVQYKPRVVLDEGLQDLVASLREEHH